MNISIVIHGESDIHIELPDLPDKRIYRVDFKVSGATGDSSYHKVPLPYSFKIDYRNLDKVWLEAYNNDLKTLFSNFHLASNFILYKEDRTSIYVDSASNRWDSENKIMFVDC